MRVIRLLTLTMAFGAMLAMAPGSAWAQGSLTGLVTEGSSGRPLSSAQVFIEGSGLGGLTNASGRYLIVNVPAGEYTLRTTLIGFENVDQMVTVSDGSATSSDFSMSQAALALDGIVVTGTAGQARRREVGNQIAQVNLADVPEAVTGIGELLQTRVVGARIQFGSGNSGSGADIRLRGNSSTALSNQPLIYIDGMRAKSEPSSSQNGAEDPYSPLNDLNPDDIDRIEVVKGPAATTFTEQRLQQELSRSSPSVEVTVLLNGQLKPNRVMLTSVHSVRRKCLTCGLTRFSVRDTVSATL